MRVRRLWVLGSLVLLAVGQARASDHVLDLFVAPYTSYAKVKGSSIDLGGWHFSTALTAKKKVDGKPHYMRLSFVGDVSVHFYGSDDPEEKDVTQLALMVGPRWTFTTHGLVRPFVHGMILGAVYRSDGSSAPSSVAGAISGGGGLDFPFSKWKKPNSDGVKHDNVGVRLQGDYIWPFATEQEGSWRVSVGVLYRFH